MAGVIEAREITTQETHLLHHDNLSGRGNLSSTKQQRHVSSSLNINWFAACVVCGTCGVVFGFAAEKGQVYVPSVIRNQMLFSQFTMMKMFLSAVAASTVSYMLLSVIAKDSYQSVFNAYANSLTTQSVTKSLIGGAILGIGMTLCGACPGMVLTQIGTAFTIAGCFSGALLYGLAHQYLPTYTVTRAKLYANNNSRLVIAFIGLLANTALAVEYFIPWTKEVPISPKNVALPYQLSWNPIIAGSIIGLLQLPLVLTIQDTLGGSSAYCTVTANALNSVGLLSSSKGWFSYFNKFLHGIGNWWQVVYVSGAVLGGALSSMLSGSWGTAVGVSPLAAFTGGICLLFGARLALGCTSGHGISGLSFLCNFSFLTVMAMFGGGITSAFLMFS